jgi:hypothetical protein
MKRNRLFWAASIISIFQFAQPAATAADADARKAMIGSVHSAGYFAPNAILVFKNSPRTAYFVEPGQVVNGVKIMTVNGEAVIAEYEGQPFSVEPASKPFAIAEVALENYIVHLGQKIDRQRPGVTETKTVTIGANQGPINDTSAVSYFVRAQPYGPLPQGVDSITFKTSYGFQKPSQAKIIQLELSQPGF